MSDVSPQSKFCPADDVVFRNVDGETVILSIGSGLYFGLTPEGTRIWELLDQGLSLGAILEIEKPDGRRAMVSFRESVADLADGRIVVDPDFLA